MLDVGCGNGRLMEDLRGIPNLEYFGVDISEPLLAAARRRYPRGKFAHASAEEIEPARLVELGLPGEFDVSVLSHVLEIVENPTQVLRSVRALSKSAFIEFFDPPTERDDSCGIRFMEHGHGPVPYLRRSISTGAYLSWVRESGWSSVTRYPTLGTYEVHELSGHIRHD